MFFNIESQLCSFSWTPDSLSNPKASLAYGSNSTSQYSLFLVDSRGKQRSIGHVKGSRPFVESMLLQQGPRIQGHILVQRTTRKVKRGQCSHCGLLVPPWTSATRSDIKSRPRNAIANQVLSLHLRSDSTCGSNQNQFANQFSQFPFTLE